MSFSFEPCLKKVEKQEKEGNEGSERDYGVTQQKLRKTPALEENPGKQRYEEKIGKA